MSAAPAEVLPVLQEARNSMNYREEDRNTDQHMGHIETCAVSTNRGSVSGYIRNHLDVATCVSL